MGGSAPYRELLAKLKALYNLEKGQGAFLHAGEGGGSVGVVIFPLAARGQGGFTTFGERLV